MFNLGLMMGIAVINASMNLFEVKNTNSTVLLRQRSASSSSDTSSIASIQSKLGCDSGYGSESEIDSEDDSFLDTCHTPPTAKIEQSQDSKLFPVSKLQLSMFFNVVFALHIVDPKIILSLIAVSAATIAFLYVIGGINSSHLDFSDLPRFRLATTSKEVVYKERIEYVPIEKYITRYIVKYQNVVQDNGTQTHQSVPSTGRQATINTIIMISSTYIKERNAREALENWSIQATFLCPYYDKEPSKKVVMQQWLGEFSAMALSEDFPSNKPRRHVPKRIRKNKVVDVPRSIEPSTRSNLVYEYVMNSRKNPNYPELPPAFSGSRAATDASYDHGMSAMDELPPREFAQAGYSLRWVETSTRNIFIDACELGRWGVLTDEEFYVLKWLPNNQMWFCADYGFGFVGEDDGSLRVVQGLEPKNEENLRGPPIWRGGVEGPFWADAMNEYAETNKWHEERKAKVYIQRLETQEENWQDAAQAVIDAQEKNEKDIENLRIQREAQEKAKAKASSNASNRTSDQASARQRPSAAAPKKTLVEIAEENRIQSEKLMEEWKKADFSKKPATFGEKMWP